MRIDLLAANDSRPAVLNNTQRSLWRVGAILEAVAIRNVNGELSLKIDNQQLPARLASGNLAGPLDGEHLKVRVLRDSPVLALEAVEEPDSPNVTEDALRRFLPKQTSPTPLLANLSWLARSDSNRSLLPRNVLAALQSLWDKLPDASALTGPETLQQVLQTSGEFLEAQLARNANSPASQTQTIHEDFKAQLLALREQLQAINVPKVNSPPPPGPLPALHGPLHAMPTGPASLSGLDTQATQLDELKQQADGALARINTTQLLNAHAAQQGTPTLLVEVPIRNNDRADLLRFKFERNSKPDSREQSAWSVEVAMDLGINGAVHAHVGLQGTRLNVRLRSDSPQLVAELTQQLEMLRAALQQQGLQVEQLVCLHGNPVDDAAARLNHLLDYHA